MVTRFSIVTIPRHIFGLKSCALSFVIILWPNQPSNWYIFIFQWATFLLPYAPWKSDMMRRSAISIRTAFLPLVYNPIESHHNFLSYTLWRIDIEPTFHNNTEICLLAIYYCQFRLLLFINVLWYECRIREIFVDFNCMWCVCGAWGAAPWYGLWRHAKTHSGIKEPVNNNNTTTAITEKR